MLTSNIAIVVPTSEMDTQNVPEAVWQKVAERILPQMGKLCTRFEPSTGAWGQKLSAPYGIILGSRDPALFLYFYASAKAQQDDRAKKHLDGFLRHLDIQGEQVIEDTKICSATLTGDLEDARSHMNWHMANMFGELLPDCGIYFLKEGRAYLNEAEHQNVLTHMKDYAICVVRLVWEDVHDD